MMLNLKLVSGLIMEIFNFNFNFDFVPQFAISIPRVIKSYAAPNIVVYLLLDLEFFI